MADNNYLKNIGYRKRDANEDYAQCLQCAHYDRQGRYSEDERYCVKHKIVIEPYYICNDYFDFSETPDGQRLGAFARQFAANMDSMEKRNNVSKGNGLSQSKSEGCYIATAVYGGYDMPQVLVLRQFRDNVLKQTVCGRLFIRAYYRLSPRVAKKLRNSRRVNQKVRVLLDKIVSKIKGRYGF